MLIGVLNEEDSLFFGEMQDDGDDDEVSVACIVLLHGYILGLYIRI